MMSATADDTGIARHFVLNGKVTLHQDATKGHRAGLDAVMLAASVNPRREDKPVRVVDLGAGVGTAGLCVASRLENAVVTLVENEPATLDLCHRTLADPDNSGFRDRVSVLKADVTLRGKARDEAGLVPDMADWVIMNPPFWQQGSVRLSPDKTRAGAYVLDEEGLGPWFRTATSLLCGGGVVSVVFPADGLERVLVEMRGRFGGVTLFPLYKGADEPAIRVIVTGVKGSRAPMRILPGLILHEKPKAGEDRRGWTAKAQAVLNGEASLVI